MLLAQVDPGQGMQLVEVSLELAQQTVEAWNATWETVISPDSQLWQNLVKLGLFLGTITILYLVLTEGKDAVERQSFSDLIKMIAAPLVIALFLSNNGTPLATIVLGVRGYAHFQVQQVLTFKIDTTGMGEALSKVAMGSAAMTQIESLLAECAAKTGEELNQCWTTKKQQAQSVLQAAEAKVGPLPDVQKKLESLNGLSGTGNAGGVGGGTGTGETAGNPVVDAMGDALKSALVFLIKGVLWAFQWGFVNLLEVALLLTAALSPIAMGLSLLPVKGRPIVAWFIGFLSLFGMQLSYNVITGLVATVLIKSQASVAGDLAFLFFLAILSPLLVTVMNSMAGVAIFNAIAFSTSAIVRGVAASTYSTGSALAGAGYKKFSSGNRGGQAPSQPSLPPSTSKGEFGL